MDITKPAKELKLYHCTSMNSTVQHNQHMNFPLTPLTVIKIMMPNNYHSLKLISNHNGTGSTSDIVSTFKEQQPLYILAELD